MLFLVGGSVHLAEKAAPPLKHRVYGVQVPAYDLPMYRAKYKEWEKLSMSKAIKAVVEDGISIRRAALRYGIPKSTLGDRTSGRVLPGCTSGPPKILTDKEEEELKQFLFDCANIGYAKTRKDVMGLVNRFLVDRGVDKPVSNGWWSSFCRRHPDVVLRQPASISRARYLATNQSMLDNYFQQLDQLITELCLTDKPALVFNFDEGGFPLNPKPLKAIYRQGAKNPSVFTSTGKSQITVAACVSAAGVSIPPMVIWDRKTLSPELARGEVPGTIYGLSTSGWMDMELFRIWFQRHFLHYAPAARPLLLLMDGHSSHFCLDTIRLAAKEGVTLFVLPPNTTHLTQPLDKGVFGPLKLQWRELCHKFLAAHPGRVITRYDFSRLFAEAWLNTMTIKNITSGFETTGVFPVNKAAIKLPITSPNHPQPVTTKPPIYTPRKCYSSCESLDETVHRTAGYRTSLSKYLDYPSPPPRRAGVTVETSARVLTSKENIQALEEKKRKKAEQEEEKRKRAEERRQRKKKVSLRTPKGILHFVQYRSKVLGHLSEEVLLAT